RGDDRVGVAELMAQLHLHRDASPLLDEVLRGLPRVGRGTATDDDDAVNGAQEIVAQGGELGDAHGSARLIKTTRKRVLDSSGLLRNLLRHERRPATLRRTRRVPLHLEPLGLDRVAYMIGHANALARSNYDTVIVNRRGTRR